MLLRLRGKGRGLSVGSHFALHCEMSEPNNGSECNLKQGINSNPTDPTNRNNFIMKY